ncbi:MAG TPA: NUDIX hydrolase [Candidatus Methanoperedens sp.]|nr:NUDIX hydrolase [Candidatus Methanoperedens sp.]
MGIEKQLPLPNLKISSKGPVAVFIGLRDIDNDPKVLLAKRPSGRYTFPGGKSKANEKPINTAMRETREETGWQIYSPEYLISTGDGPIRVVADGYERDFYLFFGFTDECMDNDVPTHREPNKNSPWEWVLARKIPFLVATGELHPVVLRANLPEIIAEAREVDDTLFTINTRDSIDLESYDFPHYGLHPNLIK